MTLSGLERTMVVTVADQLSALRKELPRMPRRNFLAEPQGKNTAPCIGLAALEVVARDPGAVMVVLPADHWVTDINAFRKSIGSAVDIAMRHDNLVTIGIRPNYPETGYGYIVKGDRSAVNRRGLPGEAIHREAFGVRGSATDSSRFALEQRHLRLESLHCYWNCCSAINRRSSQALEQIKKATRGKLLALRPRGSAT